MAGVPGRGCSAGANKPSVATKLSSLRRVAQEVFDCNSNRRSAMPDLVSRTASYVTISKAPRTIPTPNPSGLHLAHLGVDCTCRRSGRSYVGSGRCAGCFEAPACESLGQRWPDQNDLGVTLGDRLGRFTDFGTDRRNELAVANGVVLLSCTRRLVVSPSRL